MPARTNKKRHIHKYYKIDGLWHCAFSDCSHFMPKNVVASLPGKATICWGCESEIILDEDNMRDDMPMCANCLNPKRAELVRYLEDNLTKEEKTRQIAEMLKSLEP